jgi:hypothetical protein
MTVTLSRNYQRFLSPDPGMGRDCTEGRGEWRWKSINSIVKVQNAY